MLDELPDADQLQGNLLSTPTRFIMLCLFIFFITLTNHDVFNSTDSEDNEDKLFVNMVRWLNGQRSAATITKSCGKRWESIAIQLPSLRRRTERLEKVTGIGSQFIYCCYNNCIAITGDYAERMECLHRGEDRYESTQNHRIHPFDRSPEVAV